MRWRWYAIILLVIGFGIGGFQVASAHALLARSNPPADAVLATSPSEVRLWFTEPLEPKFSHFDLTASNGQTVETPASQVDSNDPTQMFIVPGPLPNDIYLVVWHSVSAADGHPATGSFAFTVGPAIGGVSSSTTGDTSIPVPDTLVRAFNLVSLALLIGGIGFWLLVWTPMAAERQPVIERRMNRLIVISWGLVGLGSVLMLLLEVSLVANVSLIAALTNSALGEVITGTRYGSLWLIRLGLWLLLGICWWRASRNPRWRWIALALGELILLTNSLFTHASAAPDALAAVTADWFHLSLTGLWVGGLVQFFNVIGPVRRLGESGIRQVGSLIGSFSNMARLCVVGLVLTGLYAAWLQVGWINGLFATVYGEALLVKLILILPLLGIAGINLVLTYRHVQAGEAIWVGRLRGLIGAEIALAIGVLVAVGAMTSLTPARAILPPTPSTEVHAFSDMQMVDEMHIQLDVAPAQVGTNKFALTLIQFDGNPVDNASARLRFNYIPDTLGQSALSLINAGNGRYVASGQNLAQTGNWRVTINIQRPDHLDTVLEFRVTAAPVPPTVGTDPLPGERIVALLLLGILTLAIAGYTLARTKDAWHQPSGWLALAMVILGIVVLVSAVNLVTLTKMPAISIPIISIQTLIGLEIALDGLLLGYWARRLGGFQRWGGRATIIGAFLALTFGFNMTIHAFISDNTTYQNAVPADPDSIPRGKVIYSNYCVGCHGVTGLGDGPQAAGLNPPPANLKVHVNAHSSQDLFDWITNGISGSAMPAFGNQLSERDRMDVINYIRTLGGS